jgi:pimeloyl-ACP methyl ester carboxylesterase
VVLSPTAPGAYPAFVGIHGSGVETRAGANRFLAESLVREGAVILLFDKRGCGRSEGDWRKATLPDLAGDVEAAFDLLAAREDVDSGRLGLFGSSQASWIAAHVAARRAEVRFLMIRSGPLTTVAEEGHYDYLQKLKGQPSSVLDRAKRILTLDDEVTRGTKEMAALEMEMASARNEEWFKQMDFSPVAATHPSRVLQREWLDFDPRPLLEKSDAAGLWIYGGQDETIPAERSAEIARELTAAGKRYEVATIPGASHALMFPPPKGGSWPSLSPAYLETTLAWFRRHVSARTRD